jgi:hypothetical protein
MVVSILGIATAQGEFNSDGSDVTTHETHTEGKSVTTTTNNSNDPASDQGPKTNVIVSDQSIPVPDNGSVSRTFTNDNGTTHVDISNSNNGSSISSSTITNNSNSSTNTSSQSLDIHTSSP